MLDFIACLGLGNVCYNIDDDCSIKNLKIGSMCYLSSAALL